MAAGPRGVRLPQRCAGARARPGDELTAFANSTIAASPGRVDNQYQALQNSGNVHLVQKLEPSLRLAGLYEGPDVLLSQVDRVQGACLVAVNELLPAQIQAAASPLRWYSPRTDAPVLPELLKECAEAARFGGTPAAVAAPASPAGAIP